MNKIFIGLLLIAATAGLYFVLQKKKTLNTNQSISKELLPGTWKIHSFNSGRDADQLMVGIMALIDSNTLRYDYTFRKDGLILRSLGNSTTWDTSLYNWKENQLQWKEDNTDTAGTLLSILKLDKDTLDLLGADSARIIFARTH